MGPSDWQPSLPTSKSCLIYQISTASHFVSRCAQREESGSDLRAPSLCDTMSQSAMSFIGDFTIRTYFFRQLSLSMSHAGKNDDQRFYDKTDVDMETTETVCDVRYFMSTPGNNKLPKYLKKTDLNQFLVFWICFR